MENALVDKRRRIEYEADAFCCLCRDDLSVRGNCIVFCDKCDAAVHQNCYGIPVVPEGEWICDECAGVVGSAKPSLRRVERESVDEGELYCLCRSPYDEERLMLECEGGRPRADAHTHTHVGGAAGKCRDWYHPECVGLQLCEDEDCAGYEAESCIVNSQGLHCIDVVDYRFACPTCAKRKTGSLTLYKNRPRGVGRKLG